MNEDHKEAIKIKDRKTVWIHNVYTWYGKFKYSIHIKVSKAGFYRYILISRYDKAFAINTTRHSSKNGVCRDIKRNLGIRIRPSLLID